MTSEGTWEEWAEHRAARLAHLGDCTHTLADELRQLTVAHRLGLEALSEPPRWPVFDLDGRTVMDVAPGPSSLLLKCRNSPKRLVVDDLQLPSWVDARYAAAGVRVVGLTPTRFRPTTIVDEVWLIDALQTAPDPAELVAAARASGRLVRVFDWLETGVAPGRPHTLRFYDLDRWLGGRGAVEWIEEDLMRGLAYYGTFPS